MNTDAGQTELVFVLVLMGLILVFGLVAVGVFVRVWRKERGAKGERPEVRSRKPE